MAASFSSWRRIRMTLLCSFCWNWSTTTAVTITTPLITICQKSLTPIITMPSARKTMTKAPILTRSPAAAAGQRGTAEHGGADGVHLKHVAGHRVRGLQL